MRLAGLLGSSTTVALLGFMIGAAGNASATQLCATTDCSEVYPAGQVVKAKLAGTSVTTFATSAGTATCKESTAEVETTAKSGTPLTGKMLGLTFGGCVLNESTNCTVTAVNLPYAVAVEETEGGNGTLKLANGGGGNPGGKVVCSPFVNCTFTATEPIFNVEGGASAIVRGTGITMTTSGGSCPEVAIWTVEYEVTQPRPMFVGSRPTVLCMAEPEAKGAKLACPKGQGFEGEVLGSLSTAEAKFSWSPTEYVSCTKVVFGGTYKKEGKGEIYTLRYENKPVGEQKEPECTSTLKGGPAKVPVEMVTLPLKNSYFEYNPKGGYQGNFWFVRPGDTVVLYIGQGEVSCYYRPGDSFGVVTNGTKGAATVASFGAVWNLSSEAPVKAICKKSLTESTGLTLIGLESNVYIASEQL